MSERQRLARLVAEAEKRAKVKGSLDYSQLLFGPQRAFVEDTAHWVLAWCSRRAGKSWGVATKMLKVAFDYPGSTVLYVTNTRRQAKRIMWDLTLIPMMRSLGIDYHPNQNELQITLANGSRILLGGANDASEIETYRGIKTPLVVIDEAQSFRSYLFTLIDEILDPATLDYDGQVYMTGTPNAACFGYFHDACHGLEDAEGWSKHSWTLLQNPHLKNPTEFLRRKRETQNLREDSPRYRREYMGEWVRDAEGMVFRIDNENIIQSVPEWDDASYVLGMDLGFVDETAFVVIAYSIRAGKLCVVDSWSRTGMTPSDVAEEVTDLQERYEFEAMVADTGGLGKAYAEEMIQRWALPIEAAEKRQKAAAIEMLNADLDSRAMLLCEPTNTALIHDARRLQWNYDKLARDKAKWGGLKDRQRLEIDDRTPDHLTDAWLYAYRRCAHYLHQESALGPEKGSKDWWERWEEDLWETQRRAEQRWSLEDEELPVDA